ncbi:hypothetical protein FHS27_006395 [Rhodopirellula rubra]|uniref:Uncharacterized protein n=1 Tax=Aporhodopirellula rubra TaxID=980271 RepID=A0A7W5H9H2_9BACT|nr:hypothetical protein [Aporhodopirellula rubra]MBB3210548.1 hypothetical protein [Aporhodopirellula rubra]
MTHRDMQPPWLRFPDLPAGELGWRMGAGEGYLCDFWGWIGSLTYDERLAYLLRHKPLPDAYVLMAADVLALPDLNDADVDAAFGVLADVGLISRG